MLKKLSAIKGFWGGVLLLGVFLLVAIIFFFTFQYLIRLQPVAEVPAPVEQVAAPTNDLSLPPVEQLSYSADVKRFLTVYLTQKFATEADKLNFLQLELTRFTNYNLTDEADKKANTLFVKTLGSLVAKKQSPKANVEKEEAALLKIMNELK